MNARQVGVETHEHLDAVAAVHRTSHVWYLPKRIRQTSGDMGSRTVPPEIIEEILLRFPPDEPAHLVRATVVCKVWQSIISSNTFRRRYERFSRSPPLQGYFCNHGDNDWARTVRFVPTSSVATTPVVHHSSGARTTYAVDCRHGRVLCKAKGYNDFSANGLIVWDPVTGDHQNIGLPSYSNHPSSYVGAMLCAMDGCDHLDCHTGPYHVVVVVSSRLGGNGEFGTWASVYSSETGSWSAPTPLIEDQDVDDQKPNLLIGDAVYFTGAQYQHCSVVKFDLRKHELSVIRGPRQTTCPMLMKGDDGGLGVAAMFKSEIHMWSWRARINGTERWVKYRIMELDKQISEGGYPRGLICMAEDTNIIFIYMDGGIFMIHLGSGLVIRKIGQKDNCQWRILPFMSLYTPKS